MVVVGLWPCNGAHIYWLPGQKKKNPILIMVLNNEVFVSWIGHPYPEWGRRAIHIGERQNLNQEHNFWSAFVINLKTLETIGGINPKKKLMRHFPSGQTKKDCVLEKTYYSLPIMSIQIIVAFLLLIIFVALPFLHKSWNLVQRLWFALALATINISYMWFSSISASVKELLLPPPHPILLF